MRSLSPYHRMTLLRSLVNLGPKVICCPLNVDKSLYGNKLFASHSGVIVGLLDALI